MSYPDPLAVAIAHGKPYPPQEQALGLTPAILPDVPACAVFLAAFIACGAANMAILKINQRRGKKFVINGMLFGFCFTRIMATTLRIVWANFPTNVKIGIAAMVFVYAGIILLFIAQLFFTQRIVRAQHPHVGWSTPFSLALPIILVVVIGTILCLIVGVIYSFFTLNASSLNAVRDIQMYGETVYMVVSFIPIPVVALSALSRRLPGVRGVKPIDKFGTGSMRTKVVLVLVSGVFLCLGATWRAATLYLPEYDSTDPVHPWYFSKWCFYVFDFTIEICIVIFWLVMRIDKRFYIPDGARGPYSYAGGFTFAGEPGNEKNTIGPRDSMRNLTSPSDITLARNSRVSWGGTRNSMGRESRISWGGISRGNVALGVAEDGFGIVPYPPFEQQNLSLSDLPGAPLTMAEQRQKTLRALEASQASDVGVAGVEAEMGWDPKTGKWALRPISSTSCLARPVSTKSGI
ncbi:Protein of unknown function (DUF3112) [Teratosphaeria destructans]|uniref:Uncharacterized protein n=1 Tax=Teratosphaeria destructans TaxID=418781 RepID=A0A9W7W2K8_9PEZI|nr:Protein of unknown function (DUF3112) [Teratosphaeria destructans]